MGLSASLLSLSAASAVGAACFALGYLLALTTRRRRHSSFHDGDGDVHKTTTIATNLLSWARSALFSPSSKATAAPPDGRDKAKQPSAQLEIENLADILFDFKMVLVVRNDLKMGKGKIAAQCSHATLGLYKKLHNGAPKALSRWETCGQVKVVLKIESEEDMLVLQERAKSLMLPAYITIDAGRTQIAPNSRTVMAIVGPAEVVDDVSGGLKLL